MKYGKLFALFIVIATASALSLPADETEYNIHSLNLFTPSNRSFKLMVNGAPVFFRIGRDNPEEFGIDRAREIKYLLVGEKLGLTPALLGYELDNGLLMAEFIEGSTPSFERMHDLEFLDLVVANLRTLHGYQMDGMDEAEKTKFYSCRHFYQSLLAMNISFDEESVSYWMQVMRSFEEGYYDGIGKGVCHGDLYYGNLLESLDGRVYLIDWEYSFYGYVIDDLSAVCSDDMPDEVIRYIVKSYWGEDQPEMFLKLKQNIFIHELMHYFWCLMQADKNSANAPLYHKRARMMQKNLNRAASLFGDSKFPGP